MAAYQEDLAYIHDTGYGEFARTAAPGLLRQMRAHDHTSGLVVDLGCGSGIWASELLRAGYQVLGIDFSPAMIALAQARAPQGEFRAQSYLDVELPRCVAVTALGECFNYLFDRGNNQRNLQKLFRRIHAALEPGGLLMFDVAAPGRVLGTGPQRSYRTGDDWAVLVTAEEDRERLQLTRDITSFRRVGELYRRSHEVHRLRLFTRAALAAQLRAAGFRVRALRGYADAPFPRGVIGFLARK